MQTFTIDHLFPAAPSPITWPAMAGFTPGSSSSWAPTASELDEWQQIEPLLRYMYIHEIQVPLPEPRAYVQQPHYDRQSVLAFLHDHFRAGGQWGDRGPHIAESTARSSASAGEASRGFASADAPGAYARQAMEEEPTAEAGGEGTAASAAGSETSSSHGAEPEHVLHSFVDIMASISPGYLPVVPIEREVHLKVRDYVTNKRKPQMSALSWTIIRILTGNCEESHYKAFLDEAKTVNQEIIDHMHEDISKWLSFLLRHKFSRDYNEFLPGTKWFPAEYLHLCGLSNRFSYYTPPKFLCIVLFNNKSRFEVTVKPDTQGIPTLLLRATQGHSEPRQAFHPELSYMEVIEEHNFHRHVPVVHGTTIRNWHSIERHGLVPENHLKPNGRSAVHFLSLGMSIREADRHPRLSSIRSSADLFIELDIEG